MKSESTRCNQAMRDVIEAKGIIDAILTGVPFPAQIIEVLPFSTEGVREAARCWIYLHAIPLEDGRLLIPK